LSKNSVFLCYRYRHSISVDSYLPSTTVPHVSPGFSAYIGDLFWNNIKRPTYSYKTPVLLKVLRATFVPESDSFFHSPRVASISHIGSNSRSSPMSFMWGPSWFKKKTYCWHSDTIIPNLANKINPFTFRMGQWFPKCAPWIPRDPRPVSRESVDIFLQWLFWSLLTVLIKGIMFR